MLRRTPSPRSWRTPPAGFILPCQPLLLLKCMERPLKNDSSAWPGLTSFLSDAAVQPAFEARPKRNLAHRCGLIRRTSYQGDRHVLIGYNLARGRRCDRPFGANVGADRRRVLSQAPIRLPPATPMTPQITPQASPQARSRPEARSQSRRYPKSSSERRHTDCARLEVVLRQEVEVGLIGRRYDPGCLFSSTTTARPVPHLCFSHAPSSLA